LGPFGFSSAEIAGLGACIIITGIVSSLTAGFLLNRFHKYKVMVVISAIGSFVLIAVCIGVIQTEDVLIIAINLICAAFFLVPIIPVSIDFAGELTFPYESTVTTGFLLMSAQLLGFFIAIAVL